MQILNLILKSGFIPTYFLSIILLIFKLIIFIVIFLLDVDWLHFLLFILPLLLAVAFFTVLNENC